MKRSRSLVPIYSWHVSIYYIIVWKIYLFLRDQNINIMSMNVNKYYNTNIRNWGNKLNRKSSFCGVVYMNTPN